MSRLAVASAVLEGVLRDEEDEVVARFQAGYQVTPVKQ